MQIVNTTTLLKRSVRLSVRSTTSMHQLRPEAAIVLLSLSTTFPTRLTTASLTRHSLLSWYSRASLLTCLTMQPIATSLWSSSALTSTPARESRQSQRIRQFTSETHGSSQVRASRLWARLTAILNLIMSTMVSATRKTSQQRTTTTTQEIQRSLFLVSMMLYASMTRFRTLSSAPFLYRRTTSSAPSLSISSVLTTKCTSKQ